MQFTDLTFLIMFMPILLVMYYLCKDKYRQIILILFSLLFYACGSPEYFLLLCCSVLADLSVAGMNIYLRRKAASIVMRRIVLALGISLNMAILGYYKYYDFAVFNLNQWAETQFAEKSLILPLGLSFFTFKAISYLIDTYKGTIKEFDIITSVNYLTFFGQMQSGPIARYGSFEKLNEGGYDGVCSGIVRFSVGFSKKVLLANVLNNITVEIFADSTTLSTRLAWLGAICFSLQLYYDFSGYSDMAIGISNMLGYDCDENFNYPYATKSVAEFWRRWHITLGSWFRDYIYIPLGGSRAGKPRLFFNLFVVWILTGLWHGANWNFVAWGLGYFVLISAEKILRLPERFKTRIGRTCYRIFTLFFINLQWVMFRCNSFSQGKSYIKAMFGNVSLEIPDTRAAFLFKDYFIFILMALLFTMPIVPALKKKCTESKRLEILYQTGTAIVVMFLFTVAFSFVVSGQNSPFLYGNF